MTSKLQGGASALRPKRVIPVNYNTHPQQLFVHSSCTVISLAHSPSRRCLHAYVLTSLPASMFAAQTSHSPINTKPFPSPQHTPCQTCSRTLPVPSRSSFLSSHPPVFEPADLVEPSANCLPLRFLPSVEMVLSDPTSLLEDRLRLFPRRLAARWHLTEWLASNVSSSSSVASVTYLASSYAVADEPDLPFYSQSPPQEPSEVWANLSQRPHQEPPPPRPSTPLPTPPRPPPPSPTLLPQHRQLPSRTHLTLPPRPLFREAPIPARLTLTRRTFTSEGRTRTLLPMVSERELRWALLYVYLLVIFYLAPCIASRADRHLVCLADLVQGGGGAGAPQGGGGMAQVGGMLSK